MNLWMLIFLLILLILSPIIYGFYMMLQGSVAAAFIMGVVTAMVVFLVFYGLIQSIDYMNDRLRKNVTGKDIESNSKMLQLQFMEQAAQVKAAREMQRLLLMQGQQQPQGPTVQMGQGFQAPIEGSFSYAEEESNGF